MIFLRFIYLYILLIVIALPSCIVEHCEVYTDPTVDKKQTPVELEELFGQVREKVNFEYQLLTSQEKENKLLLYLKDSVNTMTINAYDHMGRSKLMVKEQALGKGFYNFSLPSATANDTQYWEVKLGSQRALVFIR